jgi:RNA polymerase sigma-70 factor (ECF subfamily)
MTKTGKNIDDKAFEKIYFEYYSYLCQGMYRFVKDEEITKDIVQDVFMKYWQKIHEIRITESPKAYLYKACINESLNYLKEKERREAREHNYSSKHVASSRQSDQPDIQFLAEETSKGVDAAIDQLPQACRAAFLLSRHEQKSYKEIAKLLDISVNTVEKHIGKALKVLRKLVKR